MPIDVLALGFELRRSWRAHTKCRLHFAKCVCCFDLPFLTTKLCHRS